MAKRLTKIYTRTGDNGSTGLADGMRLAKDSARIAAIGDVDELNSVIGALLCEGLASESHTFLTGVQNDLFDLGGELSVPGHSIMTETHVQRLEQHLDSLNAALPALKEFILPGGSRAAAAAHVARAVCRRAERSLVALSHAEAVSPFLLQYLNRLSDLLFVLARTCNARDSGHDIYWRQGQNREPPP